MKNLIAILLLVLLLCGCAVPNDAKTTQTSEPTLTQEAVQTSEAIETPVPLSKKLELPVSVAYNKGAVSRTDEDGVFYVTLSNGQEEHPAMPTFTWYINGTAADTIDEVVIEFDVLETVRPLDGQYFGYDRAFFVTLHNFETIPLMPPWPKDEVYNSHLLSRGNTGRSEMINIPELGVDLGKYAAWDGEHVRIAIPYSEFQNASKDLTLQFLPGTTFGLLNIYLWGENGLYADTADTISQQIEYPERDLMNKVIGPFYEDIVERFGCDPAKTNQNPAQQLEDNIYGGGNSKNAIRGGLTINPDGSVDMPVSFYDLDAYASQIQGKYAVIPEGLVSVFTIISKQDRFSDEQQRQIIDFVFKNMMDETGQFFGVYDIAQEKMVAVERRASALPILSALLMNRDVLSNPEIDLIMNSIIAHELVRVGDTLYYAPNGIGEDGVMDLYLSDFAISDELLALLSEYSNDGRRLDEEYGCAMLLKGVANSLKLILEGQEQNATRLPSTELRVVFSGKGESYELQPSGTFDINNSYFSIGLMSFEFFYQAVEPYGYYAEQESFDSTFKRLGKVKDNAYSEKQKQTIREIEALYAETYSVYTIANTLYESWLDIYNFLKIQTDDTIYAYAYNVHTGEMIEAPSDLLGSSFSYTSQFRERFGTPAVSMNYFLLVGMFNDKEMALESGNLALANYGIHEGWMFGTLSTTNSDIFADNGLNVWGYDSLQYALMGNMPAVMLTRHMYDTSGMNTNRENWRVFAMRKMNQFMSEGVERLTPDDAFPTFYDHIPAVEILN